MKKKKPLDLEQGKGMLSKQDTMIFSILLIVTTCAMEWKRSFAAP